MTLQTFTLTAEVPDDQATAAQASCAAFVSTFAADVEGATVAAAVFGAESVLPSPADAYEAALSALDDISGPGKRPAAGDVQAAIQRLRDAGPAYEAWLQANAAAVAAGVPTAPPAGMVVASETPVPAPAPTAPAPPPVPAVPSSQPAPVLDQPAAPMVVASETPQPAPVVDVAPAADSAAQG